MLKVLTVLGIGYVLGAKAGKERYEQIRRLAAEGAKRLEAYGENGTLADRVQRLDPSSRRE